MKQLSTTKMLLLCGTTLVLWISAVQVSIYTIVFVFINIKDHRIQYA